MLIKSEFKVDLFQLKHARTPDALLAAIVDESACKLGRFIIDKLPYLKNTEKSYNDDLPEMSLNKEHHYNDHYELELLVLDAGWVRRMIKELEAEAEECVQEREDDEGCQLRLTKAEILKQLFL